jgi:hypothetical protein
VKEPLYIYVAYSWGKPGSSKQEILRGNLERNNLEVPNKIPLWETWKFKIRTPEEAPRPLWGESILKEGVRRCRSLHHELRFFTQKGLI